MANRNDFICGVYYNNKLSGFSTVTYYKNNTYIIEDTLVLERYRGNGLQVIMWKYIINQIPKNATIVCTVHPENSYSLKNALSLGFVITKTSFLYNHSPRYILKYYR